jgi:hypothetical protein
MYVTIAVHIYSNLYVSFRGEIVKTLVLPFQGSHTNLQGNEISPTKNPAFPGLQMIKRM